MVVPSQGLSCEPFENSRQVETPPPAYQAVMKSKNEPPTYQEVITTKNHSGGWQEVVTREADTNIHVDQRDISLTLFQDPFPQFEDYQRQQLSVDNSSDGYYNPLYSENQQLSENLVMLLDLEEPTLSDIPCMITCQHCNQRVTTVIEKRISAVQKMLIFVLCLLQCYCCVCIPCMVQSWKNTVHFCPQCKLQIGVKKPNLSLKIYLIFLLIIVSLVIICFVFQDFILSMLSDILDIFSWLLSVILQVLQMISKPFSKIIGLWISWLCDI